MKKVFVFLLILVCVVYFADMAAGNYLLDMIWPNEYRYEDARYALTLDAGGLIYYVENRTGVDGVSKTNYIRKMDEIGNIIIDEPIASFEDGVSCLIDSIYAASDKTIYILGFDMDARRQAVRARVVALDENGVRIETLFDKEILPHTVRGARTSALFGGMSESEGSVYLAYLNEGLCENMEFSRDTHEQINVTRFPVDKPVNALSALPDGKLLLAMADGSLMRTRERGTSLMKVPGAPDVYTFRMFPSSAQGVFFADARGGDILGFSESTGAIIRVMPGMVRVETASRAYAISELDEIAVAPGGKVAGAVFDGEAYTVFSGSESRMDRFEPGRDSLFKTEWMIAAAILAGAALLSVLIWDIYYFVLKMRLSVLVRQGILVGVALVFLVNALMTNILRPQLLDIVYRQHEARLQAVTRVLAAGLEAGDTREAAVARAAYTLDSGAEESPVYYTLLDTRDNTVVASNEGDFASARLVSVPWHASPGGIAAAMAEEEASYTYEPMGYVTYSAANAGENRLLLAAMPAAQLSQSVDELLSQVRIFLIAVCSGMFIVLLLIESGTVRSLRRLRRGVDAVSAGDYDARIRISSGDEIENLAHATNAMTEVIRANTRRLEEVGRSYYRFVPENLVHLLGETDIENVGKSSYFESRMTVMRVEFVFEDVRAGESTGVLFRNINHVIERISPLIQENGGTVYDFNPDGFIAVFEDRLSSLQAALRIREAAQARNDALKSGGDIYPADVRIVLSGGDVMLGIVGDEKRMAPTAVSDRIAVTERLSRTARASGVYILCTGDVVEGVRGYMSRYIGLERDGQASLTLYDVYGGDPYTLRKAKEMYADLFREAVTQYYQGDLAGARLLFMRIVKDAAGDGVSRNYLYCTDALRDTPKELLSYQVIQ